MPATVRIARVFATSQPPPVSVGTGRSSSAGSAGPTVRIAGITASAGVPLASVRIAGITAVSGSSSQPSPASIRIASITGVSVASTLVWNGTAWIDGLTPSTGPVSVGRGRSVSSGAASVVGAPPTSVGKGRSSTAGVVVAFTGTLNLAGSGTLTPSGAVAGPSDFSGTVNLTGGGALTLSGSAQSGPPGFGSVTVIPDPGNSPPRILIELVGFLGTTATITRIDVAGNRTPVRLGNPATLDGGTWVGYDYEAPYGQALRYEAAATLTVTSDPVTLDVSQAWLVHPGIPDLSQPVIIRSIGDRTRATNQGVFTPIGRATALTRSDGVRRAPTFELVLKTRTDEQYVGMEELLADASALLLQTVFTFTNRTKYEWVSIGDVTDTRVSKNYGDPETFWTLPCTVTDAPAGLLQSQRTWADVLAEESTWADVLNDFSTWADVITDSPIGS